MTHDSSFIGLKEYCLEVPDLGTLICAKQLVIGSISY